MLFSKFIPSKPDVSKKTHEYDALEELKNNLNSAIINANTTFIVLASLMYNIQKLALTCNQKTIHLCNGMKLVKTNGVYILHMDDKNRQNNH